MGKKIRWVKIKIQETAVVYFAELPIGANIKSTLAGQKFDRYAIPNKITGTRQKKEKIEQKIVQFIRFLNLLF